MGDLRRWSTTPYSCARSWSRCWSSWTVWPSLSRLPAPCRISTWDTSGTACSRCACVFCQLSINDLLLSCPIHCRCKMMVVVVCKQPSSNDASFCNRNALISMAVVMSMMLYDIGEASAPAAAASHISAVVPKRQARPHLCST